MPEDRFERCARLIGPAALHRLGQCTVAVFGLGGVGSFCCEALARSGVGALRIIDHDVVTDSNCNRQLHALTSTVGRAKVDALRSRLLDISPGLEVDARQSFFAAESADDLLAGPLAFVVDAIDALGPKVELLAQCQLRRLRTVTALGAAARLDPTRVRVAWLADTRGDPLASRVRKMLRRRAHLDGIAAVYSDEAPRVSAASIGPRMTTDLTRGRQRVIQPSMVMVPAAMGLAAASVVVRALAEHDATDCSP